MIRIAFCDDCDADAKTIGAILKKYIVQEREHDIQLYKFTNPYSLLGRLECGERFNLFFLDIVMPSINGIELGKKIRALDEAALIIYATSSKEFAIDAFYVNPFYYIMKPFDEAQIYQVLNRALPRVQDDESRILTVKSKKGIITVKLHMIVFVEYTRHSIVVYLSDGTVISSNQFRESFDSAIKPLFLDTRFIKTHKAFVANMNYVKALQNNKYFEMIGDGVVPIAAKMFADVKKRYMQFVFEEVNKRYEHTRS